MSALSPGLYRAKVRGIPGKSIVLAGADDVAYSLAADGDVRRCYVFTDASPLIVLDLKGWVAANVGTHLRSTAGPSCVCRVIADQIEAQTKPARIPEPNQGTHVEANLLGFQSWNEYLHIGTLDNEHWVRLKDGNVYAWDLLTNPQVVES